MNIHLHANATTTPKIRQYIQASNQSVPQLADELGVSEDTIRRWRRRDGVADGSHTPHRLQTTLAPAQEAVVVELRKTLLLPLDDLLAVTGEFIHPDVSRSSLDRCLRRHGVSNLKALMPQEAGTQTPVKTFKNYVPGFVHVDVKYLPQMPDEDQRTDLFAAIDRATRWVYVEVLKDKSATSASGFLTRLIEQAPFTITKLLTDNGKEFTDRFCATGERQPTGAHAFDRVCADNQIEHRLIKPRTPQTNDMIERFNGRIADVVRTHRFDSAASLQIILKRFVYLYNHQIPQKNLHHKTPLQTLKRWYSQQPHLFKKIPRNHPGPDIYAKQGMLERIKAEGPNTPADLVLTVDIGRLNDMVEAGVLAETSSALLKKHVPVHLRDPQGKWYGLTQRSRVIFVSKDRIPADKTFTYESLADPKYKGLICTRSGKHVYNLSLIASMIAHHGEDKTREWLKGVKANLARKPQGNDRAQAKAIFEGQCDIGIGNTYYYGKMATNDEKPEQKEWAKAIRVVFPNQDDRGAHVNISGAGVLKSSQKKEAAIGLIEFLASPKAQEIYAQQNFEYSVTEGAAVDTITAKLGDFKPDMIALSEVAKHRAAASKLVDEVAFDSGPES